MDSQYETAVSIVEDYGAYLDYIGEWKGYSFKQMSYARWAVDEILNRLSDSQMSPPLDIIEEFRDKMSDCWFLDSNTSFMFYVAWDVASDIIDCFM